MTTLPDAIGVLTVTPGDQEATSSLSAAVGELRSVLHAIRSDGGQPALGDAVDDLAAALQRAARGSVTESTRAAIVAGLDDVGEKVQPLCAFPQ